MDSMTKNQELAIQRAEFLLQNRINDISYLLSLWKLSGPAVSSQVPSPEIIRPWWKGLFDVDE